MDGRHRSRDCRLDGVYARLRACPGQPSCGPPAAPCPNRGRSPEARAMMRRNALLGALVLIFVAQAVGSRILHREPYLPAPPPLANLPLQLGGWERFGEESVGADTLAMLGPDDYLAREYQMPGKPEQAELF